MQKGKPISDHEFKSLTTKRLIKGRRPKLIVSAEIAAATETKAEYSQKRAFDKNHAQEAAGFNA
ncbi:MAG: hypothetical protein RMJ52_08320 [Gemmataceae bacterium]|nr:hypothetical protein [Gemmataceae bacterium]